MFEILKIGNTFGWLCPSKIYSLQNIFTRKLSERKKANYGIDCFEVFMERPYGFQAQAQTYSNYKKHNTVKVLIAISPCGTVSFLSKCWGERVADKYITRESGFLRLLEPGDVILADRGFDIFVDVELHGGKLEIPSFTRGKKQLSQKEVEYSQRLAEVCIHVECVIGLMKNKYTILKGHCHCL